MTVYVIQRLPGHPFAGQYLRADAAADGEWTSDINMAVHYRSTGAAEDCAYLENEIVVAVESEVQP